MSAPTGTLYPTANDGTTNIGSSVSSGDTITSAYADTQSSAILAIETALGDNPMGSDASVADALTARARITDVQNQAFNFSSFDYGSVNAYAVDMTPGLASYVEGQAVTFAPANTNTGASTLDVNHLGGQALLKNGTQPLAAGDLVAGQPVRVVYDGTNFQADIQVPGIKLNVNTQSANYTATSADGVIPVTTGASAITVTLPDATSNTGLWLFIQKADSGAGAVTVAAAGTDTINGAASASLASQYNSITLVSDGAGHWLTLATT